MSSTGINYYLNTLGIDTGNFSIFYTFTGLAGGYLPSVSLGNPLYSGQLFNDGGQFASVPNSGLFSGSNYLQVTNVTTGLSGDTTILMVYNRPTGVNGGVIFSSLTGVPGNYPSGWLLGVNDANRLYFEYYDANGPVVITSNKIYGQQNAVAMNLTQNSLSFNYYDVDLKQLETENFTVEGNYLLFSSQWTLGKTFAPWLAARPFTGFLDHFLYFDTTLSNSNITRLFSGIFSVPISLPAVSGVLTTTGITGYTLTLTGNAGIQSFNSTFSGFSSLNTGYDCGTYPVFTTGAVNNPTFAVGSGYALVPLTGVTSGNYLVSAATTGISINSGYLANFGMDFVSYLWDRSQVNNQEIIVLTGVYNLSWLDQSAMFEQIQGEFATNNFYPSGNLNVFLNGIYQVESGYTISGQYYNTKLIPLADFFTQGNQFLYTNNFVTGSGFVEYYDDNQQQNRLIVWPGWSGAGLLTGATAGAVQNMMVFLNGQKLISGIDYSIVTGSYQFSGSSGITGIFGDLIFVNNYTGFIDQTGQYDRYSGPRFTRWSTIYYLNGIRIDPSLYIESSVVDLISGTCIYDSGLGNMDNNGECAQYWY